MWSEEKEIYCQDIYAANSGTYIDTGIISVFHVSVLRDPEESGTKCNIGRQSYGREPSGCIAK